MSAPVEETSAPVAEHHPATTHTETAGQTTSTAAAEEHPTEAAFEREVIGNSAVPAKEETITPPTATRIGETAVEATPITEGVLGYKAPGLLKSFRFSKHFFWFGEEPLKAEFLTNYIRNERIEVAHHHASWAQETGKGLLFYAKRAEDRSEPLGIINLSDVSDVTKDGTIDFFFKLHGAKHQFQASTTAERAGWVVALEKRVETAKAMKESIITSEGYKRHMQTFAKSPTLVGPLAATAPRVKHSPSPGPKKSLDTTTATNATEGVAHENAVVAPGEDKKDTTTKSRSQSRKRSSIFGALLGKKDENEEKKEVKHEKKVEKEIAKEHKAEEKTIHKEEKKEEKAEHAAEKEHAKEVKEEHAAEVAAANATAPVAVVTSEEHKKHDEHRAGTTSPTEKRSKRTSLFGSLFNKKENATSPTVEKTAEESGPIVPAKDTEVPPVSATAPQIDEPVANKPIDTAAVTAPVDTVEPPAAVESHKELSHGETATTPSREKKGGLIGLIKKTEAKLEGRKEDKVEKKDESATEQIARDHVATAGVVDTGTTAIESPVTGTTMAPEEVRPTAREKRRTSLFGGLGTLKKKNNTESTSETDAAAVETNREKSPLPSKIGSLFRRPSKANRLTEEKTNPTTASSKVTPVTNGEASATSPIVADTPHAVVHDAVTMAPNSVEATA